MIIPRFPLSLLLSRDREERQFCNKVLYFCFLTSIDYNHQYIESGNVWDLGPQEMMYVQLWIIGIIMEMYFVFLYNMCEWEDIEIKQ